jgi:hypothetical protein
MAHRIPQDVSRLDVLAAISECDQLGLESFLARYGYAAAKTYQLRYHDRSYPSKAVLGVAAGLSAREFSGGAAHAVRVLRSLGFSVRCGTRPTLLKRLARPFAKCLERFRQSKLGDYLNERVELPVEPVAHFASGSNCVGDIRGLAVAGHDVGVAFPNISEKSIRELEALAGTDIQVFIDSGAFSEVDFRPGPVVVKPISDDYWPRLLDCYERLARSLGDQLHCVAPDKVGFQAETLERLSAHVPQLRRIAALGARVLVPMQRGALSQGQFHAKVAELLGPDCDWIPALPCKKAATLPEQAAEFAREVQPRRLHLLGLGSGGRLICDFLSQVHEAAPGCMIQIDACLIRRLVGTDKAPSFESDGKRRLTFSLKIAAEVLGCPNFEGPADDRKTLQLAVGLA